MTFEERKKLYFDRYATELQPESEPVLADHYIVIPSYTELQLQSTLESLKHCIPPGKNTAVIIVINIREGDSDEIRLIAEHQVADLQDWSVQNSTDQLQFIPIGVFELPVKHAGVGLARKIGMDYAAKGAYSDSYITCLDADCIVAPNYFQAIELHYNENPGTVGASIYFEHPLDGVHAEAIAQYELHLRYFNHAQRWTGFPWAFHTVGSSMSVKADAYLRVGGMNRRKAGEDFYFIHKVIGLGNFTEIRNTTIYPSDRKSDRVPFGTGRAMKEWEGCLKTYPFEIFREMKLLLKQLNEIYQKRRFPGSRNRFEDYLLNQNGRERLSEIIHKSPSFDVFKRHFFRWIDAFRVMKYCNESEKCPVESPASELLDEMGINAKEKSPKELLLLYRQIEKSI